MELKDLLESFRKESIIVKGKKLEAEPWREEKKKVFEIYRPKFLNPNDLTKSEMEAFLRFDVNKSWTGLERRGIEALTDFEKFKRTIQFLLREDIDIKERIEKVVNSEGEFHVKGMGKNLATCILHICYPEKYGVLNNVVDDALEKIGRAPEDKWGESFGDWYWRINESLIGIAKELNTDLMEVDCLMYYLSRKEIKKEEKVEIEAESISEDKVLRPLIVEKLNELFPKYKLFVDEDGGDGINYYMEGAGRCDILCTDKDSRDLIILELKKGRSGDEVVGQVQKYIGWAMENLCEKGQNVKGVIIVKEVDEKLRLAVLPVKNLISIKEYSMNITLQDISPSR